MFEDFNQNYKEHLKEKVQIVMQEKGHLQQGKPSKSPKHSQKQRPTNYDLATILRHSKSEGLEQFKLNMPKPARSFAPLVDFSVEYTALSLFIIRISINLKIPQ